MFKITISKIKRLCSVALIPRILRDEVTLSPRKLGKRPLDGFWKMAKSTDSKDREAECEKCKKLIEMVFGREKPDSIIKQDETNVEDIQMDKFQKVVTPTIDKSNENNNILPIENTKNEMEPVKKLGPEIDEAITKSAMNQAALPLNNIFKSTTAKSTEEQLAQKLESIEEPGLVEAATPKIDGFNTSPKVLGGQENILDNKNSLCTKYCPEEDAMDKIAKKCLGTPPDKIDERILEEMKSCGMLGRGRKKPTSRKSGYHAMKCHEKEPLQETKSEQNTVYYKNENESTNTVNSYPRMHNMKFTHNPQNNYPAYFKNVRLHLIGDVNSDKKTDLQKDSAIERKEENTKPNDVNTTIEDRKFLLGFSDNTTVVDSEKKSAKINDDRCKKTEASEELLTSNVTTKEEEFHGIIENVEGELEEVRVTAAETSRLGIPGEREIDPDFDHKHTKSESIQFDETTPIAESHVEEKNIEPEHVVLSNSKHPADWHLRPDLPDPPFQNPNTAISSTYPPIDLSQNSELSKLDTSISSKQNPAEYYDLSHLNMDKVNNEHVVSLSEIRPIAAYQQYTILTGTDKIKNSENVVCSTKNIPEVSSSHLSEQVYEPQIVRQESPTTVNKDISAAMGPLPQLRDMEEELSLTEMLRRVRERNRLQYCREYAYKALEPEPAEANKCPPPLDKGPTKTLGPGPCKPKPKPAACPPPPPTCPPPASPCKPKDPCAKFTKTCIIGDKIKEAFTFVLQVAFKPAFASPSICFKRKMKLVEPLTLAVNDEDLNRIEKLGSFFLSSCTERKNQFGNKNVILAKDYEPWSPIPSWPIPKTEKKEPFVCPKEGCKIIPPPRLNTPCKENPCINLPKRTFSLVDIEYETLYLYDNEF